MTQTQKKPAKPKGKHDHHNHGEGCGCGPSKTVVRDGPKIGRNDKCPCGSGKKYKKCCSK